MHISWSPSVPLNLSPSNHHYIYCLTVQSVLASVNHCFLMFLHFVLHANLVVVLLTPFLQHVKVAVYISCAIILQVCCWIYNKVLVIVVFRHKATVCITLLLTIIDHLGTAISLVCVCLYAKTINFEPYYL